MNERGTIRGHHTIREIKPLVKLEGANYSTRITGKSTEKGLFLTTEMLSITRRTIPKTHNSTRISDVRLKIPENLHRMR